MGIGTLLGYLIGNRAAILTLAAHPRAWMVGLVFVLSAGFAREYDGEDLLHEPWHLLLPLAASLAASFFLYCILYGLSTIWRKNGPSFLSGYRSFLSLFWLTAPLAWLYAIPYERFLDPLDATHANLATLALVATWRVALMIRVGIVLMGLSFWTSLFRVMAYADGVAVLAMCVLPFPLIEIMGGVRLTEAEAAVKEASGMVLCIGGSTFPIWFLLALVWAVQGSKHGTWQVPMEDKPAITWLEARPTSPNISSPLRIVAFFSLAVWIGILPFTQPEQQVRHEVEVAFREQRIGDALKLMSAHRLADFPPGWEPPPRYLKGERHSLTLDVWDEVLRHDTTPWVRELYMEKLKRYVQRRWHVDEEKLGDLLNRMSEDDALAVLNDMPSASLRERLNLRAELREKITPKSD